MARRALIRFVPDSFTAATALQPPSTPIDVDLARRQHARYADALREAGLEVLTVPADPALPDCPFVEDRAVVRQGVALITRSAHPGRRGEAEAVAAALAPYARSVHMRAPATLDGGDVLVAGRNMWVGRSERTNDAGIAVVREVFSEFTVRALDVPAGTLHLQSLCSPLDDHTVAVAAGALDPDVFEGVTVVTVPEEEAYAANVLALGRRVLVAAGHPATAAAVSRAGFEAVPLDMSEFRKADGALTCLSVVF